MSSQPQVVANKGRVLVVDDEPMNRALMMAIFEDVDDLELAYAASGEEALTTATAFHPDLVLLDIMMPGIDGYEVCRRLRSDPRHRYIKILLVSAKAMPEERMVGYRAGADDYVVKPVDDEELLAKVRVFLRLGYTEEVAEDLRVAHQRVEEASKAKDAFVAMMSHEVRTPMNGILGSLEMLGRTPLAAEQVELVHLMQRSVGALLRIVNDVLDFAKVESGRLELEHTPFDLQALLDEVAGLERGAAEAKGIRIATIVEPTIPKAVVGDPHRLRQVLLNLMDNGIKFTSQGSVTLRCEPGGEPDRVRIAVTDTGIGIPKRTVASLFDAFVQADSGTARRYGGTGLGLAICKRLVELMGGTILVDSTEGKGTTFRFECQLPAAPPTREGDRPNEAKVDVRLRANVLVVDDNEANRLVARKMMQHLGCEVTTVPSGRQAIEALRKRTFDVVMMDCSMPEMDGFETTRRLREMPGKAAAVPIVAMTAYAMPGDRARCLEGGMNDYLSKPISVAELAAVLMRVGVARQAGP